MDTNKDRQKYAQYGQGEFGINWGWGLLILVIAIAVVSMMGQ